MSNIILTADHSLMTEFRNIALFGFFSCSPVQYVPELLYDRLFAPLVPSENGRAKYTQYGLRKVEACLAEAFGREKVIVAHPMALSNFLKDADVVGLTVMDPFGIGPVTSSFAFGSRLIPYNHKKFFDLLNKLNGRNGDYKIVVGGGGAWQIVEKEGEGVDHVLLGEFEKDGLEVFEDIMGGTEQKVFRMHPPEPDEIPCIIAPSINGLVEISRGCPRHCSFCEVASKKRDMPLEKILREVELNAKNGQQFAWLHAEDVLLYRCDSKKFEPNEDAILELFSEVMKVKGVKSAGTTHFSLSAVVSNPELIKKLAEITGEGWHGVQPGIETGSPALMKRYMKNKVKPFNSEDWPEIVEEAISILNRFHWLPACTLLLGLPEEKEEDVEMTLRLVERLDRYHCILAPLFYVPLGSLKKGKNAGKPFTIREATPDHLKLIYECWRHNLREFCQGVWKATSDMNPLLRLICSFIVQIGSREILSHMEDIFRKKGIAQ